MQFLINYSTEIIIFLNICVLGVIICALNCGRKTRLIVGKAVKGHSYYMGSKHTNNIPYKVGMSTMEYCGDPYDLHAVSKHPYYTLYLNILKSNL